MIKFSIIIPTYNTNLNRLNLLVDSILSQTMDQSEYEIVFIDDGSPNGLFYYLEELKSHHENICVHRITNSGWGSRPRNVGISVAKGKYLLFMDHDDIIFPQSFEKVYDFAEENNLDVVNPKEVRTDGWTWGWQEFSENKVGSEDISYLLPMTPHKFYKRSFLLEHDIHFNEGSRVLWEDVYFNTLCFSHQAVVGVLADYPVYHWVATGENNSSSFGRNPEEKWNQIYKLMDFFIETIKSEANLSFMITHWYRTRVLGILGQWLQNKQSERIEIEFSYAKEFYRLYASYIKSENLITRDRIRDYLLQSGDIDTLIKISDFEKGYTARSYMESFDFIEDKIRIEAKSVLTKSEKSKVEFTSSKGKIIKRYNKEIEAKIPKELLTYNEQEQNAFTYNLSLKGRNTRITWPIDQNENSGQITVKRGLMKATVSASISATIQLEKYIHDFEDKNQAWDFAARFSAYDTTSHRALAVRDDFSKVAYINGNSYVAYKNKSGLLSVDMNNSVKSFFDLIYVDIKNIKKLSSKIIVPLSGSHVYGESSEKLYIFFDPIEVTDETVHNFTEYEANLLVKEGKIELEINDINLSGDFLMTICYKGKNTKIDEIIKL